MLLSEVALELPPVFKAECKCGWKGRSLHGGLYIVGALSPIDCGDIHKNGCAQCDRHPSYSTEFAACKGRARYVLEQRSHLLQADGDAFPCTCKVRPKAELISDILPALTSWCDSFISDREWVRWVARLRCPGCYAKGIAAWLEEHDSGKFWRNEWVKEYKWQPGYRVTDQL